MATGLGMYTPLGTNVQQNWEAVLNDKSAIVLMPKNEGACKIGGVLKTFPDIKTSFNSNLYSLAMDIANQTLDDAQFKVTKDKDGYRFGCIISN